MRTLFCEWCNKKFITKAWNTKTCSPYCNQRNWRRNNPEHNRQIKREWYRRNGVSEFGSPEHRKKQSDITLKNGKRGAEHPAWKGENVSYRALHYWVERCLGKPTQCVNCYKKGLSGKKIHWSNISGEYRRDLSDWQRLCVSCHKMYDNRLKARVAL